MSLLITQETQEDFLEKEMATHSNILAWEIPWTEGWQLQCPGSHLSLTVHKSPDFPAVSTKV